MGIKLQELLRLLYSCRAFVSVHHELLHEPSAWSDFNMTSGAPKLPEICCTQVKSPLAVAIDVKLGTQSAGRLLFGKLQRIRISSRSQKERPWKNQDS